MSNQKRCPNRSRRCLFTNKCVSRGNSLLRKKRCPVGTAKCFDQKCKSKKAYARNMIRKHINRAASARKATAAATAAAAAAAATKKKKKYTKKSKA